MNSRERILAAVRRGRPDPVPLPARLPDSESPMDLPAAFMTALHAAGGSALEVAPEEVSAALQQSYPDPGVVYSSVPGIPEGANPLDVNRDPHEFAETDLLVIEGRLGVAENGAVWLTDSEIRIRAAVFLAQHLAILLRTDRLVSDMQVAYQKISIDEEGFGVFVAGPSKTADIEQALVLGAHGPRSLTVLLISD